MGGVWRCVSGWCAWESCDGQPAATQAAQSHRVVGLQRDGGHILIGLCVVVVALGTRLGALALWIELELIAALDGVEGGDSDQRRRAHVAVPRDDPSHQVGYTKVEAR